MTMVQKVTKLQESSPSNYILTQAQHEVDKSPNEGNSKKFEF